MQQLRGIVLKRYMPKKQKLSVFDWQLGRIEAVVRDPLLLERIWPGMGLAYTPVEGRGIHVLAQVTLAAMPNVRTQQDLAFLHHVLELSYYFLPLADAEPDIFEIVALVCADDQLLDQDKKIMILAKFFWLIGLEIDLLGDQDGLRGLLALPLRSMLREQMNEGIKKHLILWIRRCVVQHPQRAYFKTVSFLTGTEVV